MRLWAMTGVLYLALAGWMVCTYFCTVDGYDDIPAVRNSLCRPHTQMAMMERQMACEWATKWDIEISRKEVPLIPVSFPCERESYSEVQARMEEMRQWLNHNGEGSYRYQRWEYRFTFFFTDPDTAFAFKMRWG